ncbi:hypothetical protein S83_038166 [Arachis hypogaea]
MVVASSGDEECDHSSVVESMASRNQKMKSFVAMRVLDLDASPAVAGTSSKVGLEKGSVLSDGVMSVESGNKKRKSDSNGGDFGRDWWWKQDNGK